MVTHSLWIELLLIKTSDKGYFQDMHHDISNIWNSVSSWVILRICDHEIYNYNNSLSEIWYMLL